MSAPDEPSHYSPLHAEHVALGATFTDFGGWMMPVRYASDLAEHHAVRRAAGIFDISHMAELRVAGPAAAAFLDAALTLNASELAIGRAKYALLLAPDGGIIDDLIVYRTGDEDFLVVANAGNHAPVAAALRERLDGHDATLSDETATTALIAVQGPAAEQILPNVGDLAVEGLAALRYYAAIPGRFRGEPVLVARTGYTGEDGFEVFVPAAAATALWRALLSAGSAHGLVPCGLAARDTLRLEAGMPLYGHELSLATQPAQAGLAKAIPLASKSADFIGRSAIESGPRDGARELVGLVAEGRRAAREGYAVLAADGTEIGIITSGALSPTLGHPIAMAYLDPDFVGDPVIDVRGTSLPATVVPLPFYRRTQQTGA